MDKVIKICGKNCNANFDIDHTRTLLNLLFVEYRNNKYNINLMELIAGFTFALTGDFDCTLGEESTLEQDDKKTLDNIDKLNNWLYGGYHE